MLRGYALDVYVHMDVLPVQDPVLRGLGVEVGFGIVQMQRECADMRVLWCGARAVIPQVPVEGAVMHNDLINERTDHLFGDVIICTEVEVVFEALPQCADAFLVVEGFLCCICLRR